MYYLIYINRHSYIFSMDSSRVLQFTSASERHTAFSVKGSLTEREKQVFNSGVVTVSSCIFYVRKMCCSIKSSRCLNPSPG